MRIDREKAAGHGMPHGVVVRAMEPGSLAFCTQKFGKVVGAGIITRAVQYDKKMLRCRQISCEKLRLAFAAREVYNN